MRRRVSLFLREERYEYLLKLQMEKIEELATENARLVAACDAHGVLKSIYLDPNASQTNRFKAAAASLPVEKPKLLSVVSSTEPSRAERWRAYARYQRKTEIIMETGRLPAPGSNWDLELTAQSYQPPEGDSEPPLDLYGRDAIKASYTISTLSRVGRKGNGNGNGGDESSGASE